MSGTKIAMPHPNSFQSGALSFMSCTSGRESSPLDESDSHQTPEFKTETKKKRFHPLRNLRRMFRRKTRRTSISADSYQPGAVDNPESTPTNLEQRSCSTSRLQEENLTQNLIRNSRLNPGLSLSHDSIFTPDRADSGLSSSDLENSSLSITVLTPPSKECHIKSQSSCSETSLLSIGSSEVELSPVRNANISELDLGVTSYKLSHSAAKHKMAVKPRRNHGVPRSRRRTMTGKSPLPITIEVSEEGTTGRSSPPSETSNLETPKCDKRQQQDSKISWSDIASDSAGKETDEQPNRTDDDEHETNTQRSESFFGRFLSRRSDKKKKMEEENGGGEKSHFAKKGGGGGGGGGRKTPNRRQRVEPMEIPSGVKGGQEEVEEVAFVGKKISSSVSPPRNYWPSQITSRSMSPPKVIWPDVKQSVESSGYKDWKNPNFVKELTDSVSLFAREKNKEEEESRKQHSDDLESRKVENTTKNKSESDDDVIATTETVLMPSILYESIHDGYENVQIIEQVKQEVRKSVEGAVKAKPEVGKPETHVRKSVEAKPEVVDGKKLTELPAQPKPEAHVRKSLEAKPEIVEVRKSVELPVQLKPEAQIRKSMEAKPEVVDCKKSADLPAQVRKSVEAKPENVDGRKLTELPVQPKPEILQIRKSVEAKSETVEVRKPVEVPSPTKPETQIRKLVELPLQAKPETVHSADTPEVVKRIKPAVSEKPKALIRSPKSPDAGVKNTLIERRKSELLLLTDQEEKDLKGKTKPTVKKQTSFSETSPSDKTEPETTTENVVVVLRKKSVTNPAEEQPELMKVFARRSLKIRESEKTTEEASRSRDSDKENEIVESPKEDRKNQTGETGEKPETAVRNAGFQRYGRSLSENNGKSKQEMDFKRDSIVLEENLLNKVKTKMEEEKERGGDEGREGKEGREEEMTGFKRIQQRKAEWERRAQQGAK